MLSAWQEGEAGIEQNFEVDEHACDGKQNKTEKWCSRDMQHIDPATPSSVGVALKNNIMQVLPQLDMQ
jgi:hypothetical protein